MPSIKVSEAFEKLAEQVSDERNITVADACDVIGECAVGRWNALRRHAAKKRKAKADLDQGSNDPGRGDLPPAEA